MVNYKLEFYFKIRPTTISKDFDWAYLLISLVALFLRKHRSTRNEFEIITRQ